MTRGRPRTHPKRVTEFTQWWEKLVIAHADIDPPRLAAILSEVAGVHIKNVNKWIAGTATPSTEKAVRFAMERALDAAAAAPTITPPDPDAELPITARQIVTYVKWLWKKADQDEKFRKRERVILEALAEPPWERGPSSGVTALPNQQRGRPAAGAPRVVGE